MLTTPRCSRTREPDRSYNTISDKWARAGLRLNHGKTKVWTPDPAMALPEAWEARRTRRLRCLGADLVEDQVSATPPVHGDDTDEIGATCYKMTKFAERLAALKPAGLSVQLAQSLLRYATVEAPSTS
jgi:hypothetical protein